MLMRGTPAAPCDDHTIHKCTMCGVNTKFLNVTATTLKVRDLLMTITKHVLTELYNLQPRQSTRHA